MGNPRVGGDIDSWCTSCKIMILHTVVAMVSTEVRRVQCNSCGSQHVFRAHPPGEGPRPARASAGRSAGSGKPSKASGSNSGRVRASDYDRLMMGREKGDARRYSPKATFRPGEVIQHPKFGLGVATTLRDTTKVEVLFPDGPRVLIHAR